MARTPAVRKPRRSPEEIARKKVNNFINGILRAFDGIIAQAGHLRPDQRQAAIDVLAPAVTRVNNALVQPPEPDTAPSFVLPE
jgi:hypothetical protein